MGLEINNDVLGDLYALRGGLSAISVEYDKARRLDSNYHEKLNVVADQAGGARHEAPQNTVEYANWLLSCGFETELRKRYNSIQEKKVTDYSEESYKHSANRGRKDAKITFLIMLIGLIVATASIIGLFLLFNDRDLGETLFHTLFDSKAYLGGWAIVIFAVLAILALLGIIWTFYWLFYGIKDIREFKNDSKTAKETQINNNKLINAEKERVANERKIAQSNLDMLPIIRANTFKVLNERNDAIKPMIQSCNAFFTALLEQFTPLLDERDWQHLDLVIYELETRRAESIKEALQLVDRELQTERIERTIGEATKTICYTLQRGFTYLQQSIETCCNKIYNKLDDISSKLDTISTQMTVQSLQLAHMGGQLAELCDSVNMSNALQAKANVTSNQLLSDVHAIRYYQ